VKTDYFGGSVLLSDQHACPRTLEEMVPVGISPGRIEADDKLMPQKFELVFTPAHVQKLF